jgi:hypothetical protein
MSKHVNLTIDRDSPIGQALGDPSVDEVTMDFDGRRFKVIEEQRMTDEDRERYWQTHTFSDHLARFPNLLQGIDADELKEDIARWRREGSREPVDE